MEEHCPQCPPYYQRIPVEDGLPTTDLANRPDLAIEIPALVDREIATDCVEATVDNLVKPLGSTRSHMAEAYSWNATEYGWDHEGHSDYLEKPLPNVWLWYELLFFQTMKIFQRASCPQIGNRMKKKLGLVAAIILTTTFAGLVIAGLDSSNSRGPGRDVNHSTFQVCSGTIEVAARITDENGESLSGVSVNAFSTKHGVGGFTTGRKSEQAVADGFFHIRETDICGLTLHFSKPGFYGETVKYSVMRDISHIEDVLDLDRVIVLKLRPIPAPMERIEGILKTNVSGPTAVVRLQPGTRYASPVISEKQGGLDSLGDYCFLNLRIEYGRIDSAPRKGQSGGMFDAPKGASLRSSGSGDGFVLFRPVNEYPIARKAFREMRVAPQGGYIRELEIPPGPGPRVYFYCFLGGMYGKGYIVKPTLREEEGESTAVSVVKILLNPKGDRNVATLD